MDDGFRRHAFGCTFESHNDAVSEDTQSQALHVLGNDVVPAVHDGQCASCLGKSNRRTRRRTAVDKARQRTDVSFGIARGVHNGHEVVGNGWVNVDLLDEGAKLNHVVDATRSVDL